ncbi:MAG: hypothetical protein U5J63_03065 [Fodinibius sp.]|nr:hypothetical protein [Fodinibius sp.]
MPYIKFFLPLFLLATLQPLCVHAQETDTTRQELNIEDQNSRTLNLQQRTDRSMSGGVMSDMGTYNVPSEGQYYDRPFMGQYYLDKAVEAYRQEMESGINGGWFWQFLKSVSPFIRLQMGPMTMPEMEYVDRDNPLWESYMDESKMQ